MSKLINDLVGTKCKIQTDEVLAVIGSTDLICTVLDSDDEWIKVRFADKKNNVITKIMRIENIDGVEMIEEKVEE